MRPSFFARFVLAPALGLGLTTPAHAQTLGGVFPPGFGRDFEAIQYRAAYDTDAERFGNRLHYDRAFGERFMGRGVVQAREFGDDVDFDFIGGELFVALNERNPDWWTGLRFDVRLRDDDRPASFGVNWTNQFQLSEDWRARAILLGAVEIGDNGRDGILLQSRGQIDRALGDGVHVGGELFSVYGSTEDFRSFDEQSHEIGPYIQAPFARNWQVFGQVLLGVTDGAPDTTPRIWVTRVF